MKNKILNIVKGNWLRYFLILFIGIFSGELIFRACCDMPIFSYQVLRIMISTSFLSLIFSYLISFCGKILSKILLGVVVFLTNFYAWIQLGFNNFIGVFMSFGTSSQLGAVTDYVKDFIVSFKAHYYLVYIPFILVLLYLIFIEKKLYRKCSLNKKNKTKLCLKKSIVLLVSSLILIVLFYMTLVLKFMQNELQLASPKSVLKNPSVPSTAIAEFGTTVFVLDDIKITLFPQEEELSISFDKNKKEEVTDYTRVIDDTAWETVIKNEKRKTYNNLNNYFISQEITSKNEYTGLFKGKNVIVIMMESINDIIINPELYPNFYKMYSEGWHWTNNYSPRNSCATGNNEMSGMLSLYSINNNCTANRYKNNKYSQSIFNVFNEAGYRTTSMHNYTEGYYYRSTIHKNMGSGKYYGVRALGIDYQTEYKNWSSDADFMESALNILDKTNDGKPFMTWLTTVSAHQPYSTSSILGDKYLDMFKDYNYPKDLKRYLSKVKVTDDGLGILLKGLEERGILDDTVIVMYGDHYPYGLSKSTISKILTYDLNNYEAERVPFVIYNSQITPKSFDEYTSYINILPTVANLFDLNYDPRLYVGTDLLSDSYESLVVFADGSWKNERAYYNASTGRIKNFTDNAYTNEEVKAINEKISYKMKMSSLAIKNNYFNYLDNQLSKYKVVVEEEPIVENNVQGEVATNNTNIQNNVNTQA